MMKVIVGVIVVTALALSCGEEEGITQPPRVFLPADVLESVETSFDHRDIDLLDKCLSSDFVFYFDPDDVGQKPPGKEYEIPESWSYTEFWRALSNLFYRAYYINLYISSSRIGIPGEKEIRYKAENVSISLLVMVDELNGYIADGGYCNFAFGAYYNEKEGKQWRLTGWWDFTSVYADEAPGLEPTSLGKILAMYK
jgi:hypothetical protein